MSESKPTPAQAWREIVERARGPWRVQRNDEPDGSIHYDVLDDDEQEVACVRSELPHDARLIVAQRRIAEALVKWIDAESDCRIAHDARAVYTRRTNEAYLAARERRARAADALYAACVAAVGAKL